MRHTEDSLIITVDDVSISDRRSNNKYEKLETALKTHPSIDTLTISLNAFKSNGKLIKTLIHEHPQIKWVQSQNNKNIDTALKQDTRQILSTRREAVLTSQPA